MYIRVKNWVIVLASKDNTKGKNPNLFTQKFWIKPPWLWCLKATFYIDLFFFHLLSSRLYTVFRFVSLRDRIFILFLLMIWPEYLFLKKTFQIPLRIKWPSPKRYIGGSRRGQVPLFVLDYRLVETYFNRIFPVSSLSFFFLPCLIIFALNYILYILVSWYFYKKNCFWNKTDSPYSHGNVWIRLWDTCTLVHCRTLWSVVNLWRRYNDLCCRLCKFSVLVNKCQVFM